MQHEKTEDRVVLLKDFELKMQTVQLPKRRASLQYKMMCEVHNNNMSVSTQINHYAGLVDEQQRSLRVHIQRRGH